MRVIEFCVDGSPVPKARPRLGRGGHTYTPTKTKEAENRIATAFRSLQEEPLEGPLEVRIDCTFTPPQSWSKKKTGDALEGRIKKISRPDVDNLAKTVCDALNGIAWKDDSQITQLSVRKKYGARPRIEVTIIASLW